MQLCSRCHGSKEILGIGGMYVKCTVCGGTGTHREPLKVEDIADKLAAKTADVIPVVKAKRSRKKVVDAK